MTAMALFRRHKQGIGLWLAVVLFASGCVLLGRWQLHRYQAKHERSQQIGRSQALPTVPLAQLLPSMDAPLSERSLYRAVTVSGTYLVGDRLLVRNRPHTGGDADPTFGYEVLVPLRTDDGSTFLVDRGWIPNGRTGQRPDAVPATPSGHIEVVARLRRGEPKRGGDLPSGQVGSINLTTIMRDLGYPVYQSYGALLSESPRPPAAPALLDPEVADGGEGINASYAVQWLVFAAMGLGFPIWLARRRGETPLTVEDDPGPDEAPSDRPARPVRERRPKHHIWDDEDE